MMKALTTEAKHLELGLKRALKLAERTEPLTGVEWADKYYKLPPESSLIQGDWVTLSWQCAIINAMTNDDIRGVSMMKSKRTGYTKMLTAAIGYYAEHKPRKVGVWQPTDTDAKEFCLIEVEPMIREVKEVRRKFPYYGKKNSHNTIALKQFIGAPLYIRGGKSAKNYRRITLDVAILDELSAFDADIDNEGDASDLAYGRTEGAPFRKLIRGSTPKIKGECQIEGALLDADAVFDYFFPCPHCNTMQPLKFGGRDTPYGFKWIDHKPETVKYLCPHCSSLISQNEFAQQLETTDCEWRSRTTSDDVSAKWLPGLVTKDGIIFTNSDGQVVETPEFIGFRIWAGYSPLVTWRELVRDWLKSCRDPLKTKTFVNTVLGETYDIASGDRADKHALKQRALDLGGYSIDPLPERVCYITAGVDVQPDRFEVQVLGWGIGAECWVLEYKVLPCDTSVEGNWDKVLDPELTRIYQHPKGQLSITFTAIDTGGTATQEAYKYCKANDHKGRLAIKGRQGELPIIPLQPSRNWSMKGLKGWIVGVDTAKTQLYRRLEIIDQGQGFIHFPITGLPEDYYDQLTAEKRRMRIAKNGRREYYWWKPEGARVESLDTFVYAMAALEHSGVDLALQHKRLHDKQSANDDFAALARKLNQG